MIDDGSKSTTPFEVIPLWKFSRSTRRRGHTVALMSMLRRKRIQVVSITERAAAAVKRMEVIIESVDESHSDNLAQEVAHGMRASSSRGIFPGAKLPFSYTWGKDSDGVKERPTLEVNRVAAPIVKEI